MPLTPEDVANKQFTSTRLKPGYDETEVDEFLDEVEAELTRLYRENDELRNKLASTERALAEGGDRGAPTQQMAPPAPAPQPTPEPTPPPPPVPAPAAQAPGGTASETATGILALAQRTADEHISEARTQADRMIGEARARADQLKREADDKHRQIIGSLENERVQLEREVEKLRAFEREYRSRLKAYLEGQLRELEGHGSQAPSARPAGGPQGGPPGGPQGGGAPQGVSSDQGGLGQAPRSPFSPGAPVGGSGNSSPSGPPQQAQSGFALGEGPEARG
ncbi:MAG: DivIVA domain-containing protein [Actinomycetes bacterium]